MSGNRILTGLTAVMISATAAGACRGTHSAPDGRDTVHTLRAVDHHAPSEQQMMSGRFDLVKPVGTVILQGGTSADDTTGRRVTLRQDLNLVGDLLGDGGEEAVALLTVTRDGVETHYLAVFDVRDGLAHTVSSAAIGSSLTLRNARLDGRRIVISVEGPDASPSEVVYRLEDDRLVRAEPGQP